jgi:hypothetical protein
MRVFRGSNLKDVPPELIPHFRAITQWTAPASRALARSIEKQNNPAAVITPPVQTPPNPNPATEFLDNQFRIKNGTVFSKQLAFNCASISGSTLITLTVPSVNGTIALVGHTHVEADLILSDNLTNDVSNTKHGFVPKAIDDVTKFLRSDGTWATAGVGTHNLLSATHPDTAAASPLRGDIIVANSTPAWAKVARGGSGTFVRSDGTDTVFAAIVAGDLPAHGAAQHTNRTRSVPIPIGCWETNAKSLQGTSPDAAAFITMGTGAKTQTHIIFRVPMDYVSAGTMNVYVAQSGTDVTDFLLYLYTKKLTVLSTLITAAFDNQDGGALSPPGVANQFFYSPITIATSIAAGDFLRFTVERDPADTNTNTLRFLGADFEYVADM